MITKCFKKKKMSCCESAEKVASNDDLIAEILLYVPASSLLRFKYVSKHWLSLITSPHLSRLHIRRPLRPSGIFIPIDKTLKQTQYRYIPLNSSSPSPSRTITFPSPGGPNGIAILQSCNGLLFCTNSYGLHKYYVYNPTTGKFTNIPVPQLLPRNNSYWLGNRTTLAFDPLRSLHYKLVYAHRIPRTGKHQIVVYSSETQLWKVCGDQLLGDSLWNGVYLNGAVHYMSFSHHKSSIYLKINEERLETMPMPPIPNNNQFIYFGQSGGRLHLITANDNGVGQVLDVYEMEKDYSNWCVRYQVELREVYRSKIMGIVRGEREEDSFLLFNTLVDGFLRFMKYTFADKTLKMLFEIEDPTGRPKIISYASDYSKAFEFIQTLSPV